jgi:hypothetical protein
MAHAKQADYSQSLVAVIAAHRLQTQSGGRHC